MSDRQVNARRGTKRFFSIPLITRFSEKVIVGGECWEWVGHLNKGYGMIYSEGRNVRAHRVSYEMFVGPIASGLEIDHLCRNTRCVNPSHLEPVTHKENGRRAIPYHPFVVRTHCKNGHEFSQENTRLRDGGRVCVACRKQRKDKFDLARAALKDANG